MSASTSARVLYIAKEARVVAGMVFSLAVALLAEELIFGQVFRLFFSQQAVAAKAEPKQ